MKETDRRVATRFPLELEIDLHSKAKRIRMHAADVSRHGMFIPCSQPPPLHHAVLLTVRLRGGPFETMATVVWRVTEQPFDGRGRSTLGMGLKLFCLGSDAKHRWDRFVKSLETPGVALPTRPARHSAACFMVQLDSEAELLAFYLQNVTGHRTLYVSPAVRLIGARVAFVFVHPKSHEEHVVHANVVEWNADHPLRMGVRFESVDREARRAFQTFLGKVPAPRTPSTPDAPPLVGSTRLRWTEYAFFSPKVRAQRDPSGEIIVLDDDGAATPLPPTSNELDVIEGELFELPELALVDKSELFDFAWNADETDQDATDPHKKRR